MNRLTNYLLGGLAVLLPAMIDSALKGMALLGLVGLAAVLLRGASAATRHLTWLLGLVGLLVLPLFSVILPDWRVLPAWASVSPTSPGTGLAAPELTAIAAPTAEAPTGTVMERTLPVTSSARTSAKTSAGHAVPSGNLAGWLAGLWIVGTGFLTARLVACFIWLRVASGRAEPVSEGPLADALARACQQLAIHRSVKLSLDKRRIVPLVWGILRPHLILPEEARTWDTRRLRAVLLHELAHVKRHDLLALWLTQVACAIHWFNPLVWLAGWRLHMERERACDDLVLNAGVKASDYAEHLVHVATKLETVSPVGALGMARPSRLEGRLLAVLNERLNRRAVTRTLALAALACGLGVVVPMAMLRAKAIDDPPPAAAVQPEDRSQASTAQTVTGVRPSDVVTLEIAKDGALSLSGKIVPWDRLTGELALIQRTNANVVIVIRAPTDLPYASLIRVMDALKQVPIAQVSLSPATNSAGVSRVRLRQAERELERASDLRRQNLISESEYDKAKHGVELRRAELSGDQAEVVRAKLRHAEAELKRITELHAQKLVSAHELDQVRLAVDELKAQSYTPLSQEKKDRLRQLLAEEIRLAEDEAKLAREHHKAGTATLETCLRADLEVLALKREMAGWEGNKEQAIGLVRQQIHALEELQRDIRDQRKQGTATQADELKLRRQILSLQRQLFELE